jgi:hypothetical protein
MLDQVKIIEVVLIKGDVLVVFSDGRITTLHRDYLYSQSVELPPYPGEVSASNIDEG